MSTIALNAVSDFSTSAVLVPYQRSTSGTTTNVVLSGTYTGTAPSGVEVQLNSGSFTALTSMTISGGNWTGTLASVTGGEYTMNVREANDHTVTISGVIFLLGDAAMSCGDSIAAGQNITSQNSSATAPHAWWWHGSSTQFFRTDIIPADAYYPLLGTLICADQSVPFMFFNGGSPGTHIPSWNSGSIPNAALAQVTASTINALRFVIWHLGTNNVISGGAPQTRAQTESWFVTNVAYINANLPGAAPVHTVGLIGDCPSSDSDLRTAEDQIRLGITDGVTDGHWSIGPNLSCDYYPVDNTHPSNNLAQPMANRQFWALKDATYGGSLGRGPRLFSATIDSTKMIVRITFDQSLSTTIGTSVAGFRVMDSGTSVTITSQVVTGARVVTLTLPTPIAGTCTVSFASNNDGVNVTVPLSASLSLPTGGTDTRQPEPFIAASVTNFVAPTARFSTVFAGVAR